MVPSCRTAGLDNEILFLKLIHLFIKISPVNGITLYANLFDFYIIILILRCYSFYSLGDYDYTNYDCECRVGYFFTYIKKF